MGTENEAILILTKEIIKTIKTIVKEAPFDHTRKGKIISYLGEKYYEVQLGRDIYKAYSPAVICNKNDIVYVKIAENNYNNLIIECIIR